MEASESWAHFPQLAAGVPSELNSTRTDHKMAESKYIHASHKVSNLVYHFVCLAKYRRVIFTDSVDESLVQICTGIEMRYYWIRFLEIVADKLPGSFLDPAYNNHSPSETIKRNSL